jgi:hypothetical protein
MPNNNTIGDKYGPPDIRRRYTYAIAGVRGWCADSAKSNDMTTTTIHPLILTCCAKEDGRYAITKPFTHDGFVYATDGHIIARMRGECEPNDRLLPPVISLPWDRALYSDKPLVIPPDVPPFKTDIKCERCNGNGAYSMDGGPELPCDYCMGSGTIDAEPVSIYLGPVIVSNKYLTLLQPYGAKLYAPKVCVTTSPAYFTADGGVDGLLAQRTK